MTDALREDGALIFSSTGVNSASVPKYFIHSSPYFPNKDYMNIRLNKAIKEFGVGLQTISDFPQDKRVVRLKSEDNLNQKLDEKQYDLLKKEFGADKDLRNKAEEIDRPDRIKKTLCTENGTA